MTIAALNTLITGAAPNGSATQNMSQFKGLAAAYQTLLGGVPTIDGFTFLINNNNTTNFGAGGTTEFNDENVYINVMNALYQGNATAKGNFDAIVTGQTSAEAKLTAIYNHIIPPSAQSDAGRAYFIAQADFYQARAAELGIAGDNGAALVGMAALIKIAVDNDIAGIGDSINDLMATVADGTAMIPQDGSAFTPIEQADGTNQDADDGGAGGAQNFTVGTDNLMGTPGEDTFNGTADVAGLGAVPPATINGGDAADGGAGVDTANIVSSSLAAALPAGLLKNIEIINLISDIPGDSFAPGTANVANFMGVQQLWQIAGAASQDSIGHTNSTTAGFKSTVVAAGAGTVNVAAGAPNTTANVALSNVTTGAVVEITETTAGGLKVANVSGDVAGAGAFAVTLDGAVGTGTAPTAETTINLAITSNSAITLTSTTATTNDASKSTGNLTFTTSGATKDVKGGSGNDIITGVAATTNAEGGAGNDTLNMAASGAAVTIKGEAGNDIMIAGGFGSTQTGGTGGDQMTAGGGTDTFIIDAGDTGLTNTTIDVVTGFATTVDKLDFNLSAGSGTNFQNIGGSSGIVDGKVNADTVLDGTVQYVLTAVADADPYTGGAQAGFFLYIDRDLDGSADEAIGIVAAAPIVAGDIIA